MRILLVGAGGVGTAFAQIAARRRFADLVIADYDLSRAQRAAEAAPGRFTAVQLDARDEQATAALLTAHGCDVLMNATDPRFVMPLYRAALQAGTHYLDMAMSLSHAHQDEPYAKTGVKLGDDQFALAAEWEQSGKLALVGIGVEPGLSDVFARYAADTLFSEIDEIGVRDGANLEVAATTSRPPSRSGPRSRSASTRRWSGRRAGAGSRPRRSASPRPSPSRPGSARSSA